MKLNLKSLLMSVVVVTFCLTSVIETSAIPNPGAIRWSGSTPYEFAVSLYAGVLGRSPESVAVAQAWASNVNSNPNSRLSTFFRMLNETEYREGFYGKQRKRYRVYVRRTTSRKYYTVFAGANRDARWTPIYNRYFNRGEGVAVRNFYQTYYSRR